MADELLSCPFCGNDARIILEERTYQIVGCNKVSMLCPNPTMTIFKTGDGYDYKYWNRRKTMIEKEKRGELNGSDFDLKIIKDIHVEGHIIISITHNGYQWSSISVTRNELKQIGDRIFSFLTKNQE